MASSRSKSGVRAYLPQLAVLFVSLAVILGVRLARDDGDDSGSGDRAAATDGVIEVGSDGEDGGDGSEADDGGDADDGEDDDGSFDRSDEDVVDGGGRSGPEDLEDLVLRESDLPAGWIAVDPDLDFAPLGLAACFGGDALTPIGARTSLRVTFRQGESGPLLSNLLVDQLRSSSAEVSFDSIRTAVDGCIQAAGDIATELPAPTGADEALAIQLEIRENAQSIYLELRAARVGHQITSVLVIGLAPDDLQVAAGALNAVVARLR